MPELAEPRKRSRFTRFAAHLKDPRAGNANLDFVAILPAEGVDHSLGQPHRQTIPPLRYLHDGLQDIHANSIFWRQFALPSPRVGSGSDSD